MAYDIGPRVGIDGEKQFKDSLKAISQNIKTMGAEMKALTAEYAGNENSIEALTAKNQVLGKGVAESERKLGLLTTQAGRQREALNDLAKALDQATQDFGENSDEAAKAQNAYNRQYTAVAKLDKQIADTRAEMANMKNQISANERAMDNLGRETDDAADAIEKASRKFDALTVAAGNLVSNGIQAVVSSIGNLVSGLVNLDQTTEEYRRATGRLTTAFEAAGYGTDAAQKAYSGLYAILGDTDTATEAAQLMAKLAESEEDMARWTEIAAGVSGTFGDALPVEGLIEAANETAKVGQVTGTLADALNWAGINEDAFNEKLKAAGGESERNALIMSTLSGAYDQASAAFYRNNEALVQARENQAALDASMGQLGNTISNIKNNLMAELLPAISAVAEGFNGLLTGETTVAQFTQTVGGMVGGIGRQIVENLPQIVAVGGEIVTSLATKIAEGVPELVSSAANLVANFGAYIRENLPTLLSTGLDMVSNLAESVRENVGIFVDSAISLALDFAKGLADSIPSIVAKVPGIVSSIANTINDNAPKILAAGVRVIVTLIKGIIDSVPDIIANIPKIISAFVDTLMAFNWLNLGKTIITALKNGIVAGKSFLAQSGKDIVNTIKNSIKQLPSQMVQIGKNIIQGLVNGLKSMGSWLKKQIGTFCTGVLDGFLDFFGIASPSKLFRDEVGRYVALGVAEGIADNGDEAVEAAESMAREVYERSKDWADRQTKYQAYTLAEQIELWETIQGQFVKGSKQYADAEEKIFDLRQQKLEEYQGKVEEINSNIQELESSYQKTLSSRTKEIFDSYSLFEEVPQQVRVSGQELIKNLENQISSIESFYAGLDELSARGAGADLVAEIRDMGPDAAAELSALLALSDEKLAEYAALYQEKQALANSVAIDELASLREETDAQIQENLTALEALYNENAPLVGQAFADGLSAGIESGMSGVISAATKVAQAAVNATKNVLGIRSPSTVFASLGGYMAEGLGLGFERKMGGVAEQMQNAIPTPQMSMGDVAAGMVNGIQTAMAGASGGTYTINLRLPDDTLWARYQLPNLIDIARANGTPIVNPT